MEKIRNFDLADLSRAAPILHNRLARRLSADFEWNGMATLDVLDEKQRPFTEKQNFVQGVAEKMYQTHKEWTEKKFEPLVSYVQLESNEGAHEAIERISSHYKNGLATAVPIALRMPQFDYQDIVASYTTGFVNMLRTCERFDIDPESGLKLAQQSYNMSGSELAQCFKDYPELADHVIKRAASSTNPHRILNSYIKEARWRDKSNLRRAKSEDKPFYKHTMPIQIAEERDRIYRVQEGNGYKIDGVPIVGQRHGNWCGYASLSMVMQYMVHENVERSNETSRHFFF